MSSKARPTAATGTSTGATSTTAGRIRPTAARTSRVPMVLTPPALKSSTHAQPEAASLPFGRVSFQAPPAREPTASSPATIHRAMFNSCPFRLVREFEVDVGGGDLVRTWYSSCESDDRAAEM